MSDIFISYSNKDRPWVEQFAKTLGTHGWSVWWDRDIPTGQTFDTVIEKALEARNVRSLSGPKTPSRPNGSDRKPPMPLKRMILLPVRIDKAKLPLEFRRFKRSLSSIGRKEARIPNLTSSSKK